MPKHTNPFLLIGVLLILLTSGLTLAQDAGQPIFTSPTNITNPTVLNR